MALNMIDVIQIARCLLRPDDKNSCCKVPRNRISSLNPANTPTISRSIINDPIELSYFGYLLWWSRSLWLPVIIHAFNNSIVVYSTWKSGEISEGGGDSSIDQWGLDSPMLILASAILTVFIIFRLHREQKSAVIQRVK